MATNYIIIYTTILYYENFRLSYSLYCILISESINSLTVFIQFIVLLSFPMVFSIDLFYKIVFAVYYFHPVNYPANAIYFSGLLIIAVFEVSAVYFCSAT